MLQFLVDEHLPGQSLPKRLTSCDGLTIDPITHSILDKGHPTFITRTDVIAIRMNSSGSLYALYNSLKESLIYFPSISTVPCKNLHLYLI
jgi:hypothetical protein